MSPPKNAYNPSAPNVKKRDTYLPINDRIPNSKASIIEITGLTDEQIELLLTVDDFAAMPSGTLQDSIWAPGNENKQYAPIKTPTAAPSGHNNETVPSGVSASQSKTSWKNSTRVTVATAGKQQPPAPTNDLSSVAPHLRVTGQETPLNLPPHLQPVNQSTRFNGPPQLSNLENTEDRQIPQNQAKLSSNSITVRHNETMSIPCTSGNAGPSGILQQTQHLSPSKQNEISQQSAVLPIRSSFTINGSQEDAFMSFLNNKVAAQAKTKELASRAQEVSSKFTSESTSQNKFQTSQSQSALGVTWHSHSVSRHEDFTTFLSRKEKESLSKGRRYHAASTNPAHKEAVRQPEQRTQPSTLDHEKSAGGSRVDTSTTLNRGHLMALPRNNMAIQSSKTPWAAPHQPYSSQGAFKVPRSSLEPSSTAMAKVLGQSKTSAEKAIVNQNNGNSNDIFPTSSVGWDDPSLLKLGQMHKAGELHKAIVDEFMGSVLTHSNTLPLTEGSLAISTGLAPRVESEDSLYGQVSDEGIRGKKKENVRATQGIPATEELLDFQNKWMPPPCNWEVDRPIFDISFMPKYIREDWAPGIPCGPSVTVDISAEGFRLGKLPVNGKYLGEEVIQPDSIPDIKNSEKGQKRLLQTAELDSFNFIKAMKKRTKNVKMMNVQTEARYREIAEMEFAPHPYAPAIDIYLRPATLSDVSGIKAVYNYYIKNSIIPEDQVEVSEDNIAALINTCKSEKLPCVVAIRGCVPSFKSPRNSIIQSKSLLPKFENVIGFGVAQTYGYGFSGLRTGRSRTTADLQFYVHHEYTRKGVGRSILDRLIQCLSPSYAGKDGYSWLNPNEDPTYKVGGAHLMHQLVIQLPVNFKDDTTLPWFTEFLTKYWFDKEARLARVARSTIARGQANFLDLVIFTKEISVVTEHPGFT